jgi:hypothetical protein
MWPLQTVVFFSNCKRKCMFKAENLGKREKHITVNVVMDKTTT